MIKVLFVCWGNICRSPMCEFVMKDMVEKAGLADHFYIESAATSSEEIWGGRGNPVYPPAREELARHGLRCDGKYARKMTKDDYLIICGDFGLILDVGSESKEEKYWLKWFEENGF